MNSNQHSGPKRMIPLGSLLETALRQCRPSADTGMLRIWDLWEDVVGVQIAREAKPGAFKDGNLIVHVSSSVWVQHLTFMKHDIRASLNLALDADIVTDIKFKVASIHS